MDSTARGKGSLRDHFTNGSANVIIDAPTDGSGATQGIERVVLNEFESFSVNQKSNSLLSPSQER